MKESNFLLIKRLILCEFPRLNPSEIDGNIYFDRHAQSWVWVTLTGSKNIGRSIAKIKSYGLNLDRR